MMRRRRFLQVLGVGVLILTLPVLVMAVADRIVSIRKGYRRSIQYPDGTGKFRQEPSVTMLPGERIIVQPVGWVAPTPVPPTPTPTPPPSTFPTTGRRPYTDDSPWNLPIMNPVVHPQSAQWVGGIATTAQPVLRSDPTQYAYPVYFIDPAAAPRNLILSGRASVQNLDGTETTNANKIIPGFKGAGLQASPGTDSQIIMIDPSTGDEWDVWQFDGTDRATNATLYKGGVNRKGTTHPTTYWSRGSGLPYLGGLIRPWEIAAGKIEHALAFAYHSCSPQFVYPATKSDGHTTGIPEGQRIQLDPAFDVNTLAAGATRIIAKALQEYGMYCIDNSGANKIVPEAVQTANWTGVLSSSTVNAIPINRLRVLA